MVTASILTNELVQMLTPPKPTSAFLPCFYESFLCTNLNLDVKIVKKKSFFSTLALKGWLDL